MHWNKCYELAIVSLTHRRIRGKLKSATHHSDRGSQYLSIRYTERLAAAGFKAPVGSVGDSYGNAPAETINRLFKSDVIGKEGSLARAG